MSDEKIIFATKNEGKINEIRLILDNKRIITLNDAQAVYGREFNISEDGVTFEQNAVKKAETISKLTNMPCLADDSGLEIDFLDNAPGVLSARFMGEDTPYAIKNAKILDLLKDVPFEKRAARFVCVIAYAAPDTKTLTTRGVLNGFIHRKSEGENGFGYDPIFFLPELNKTTAQLTAHEKNAISHRGKALSLMREKLP